MQLPADVAHVIFRHAETVRAVAGSSAFYVGGSLATGDYRAGVSDFDLVALVEAPLTAAQQDALQCTHEALMEREALAAKLHCVYVPVPAVGDVAAAHVTWAHGELYRRPLSGVARAELLRYAITVFGPPPNVLIPRITRSALDAAVRGELDGYWRDALAKAHLWCQDVYVDLGLLTLARAEATLANGRLITKREAIPRLTRFGVAPWLVQEIKRRRDGHVVAMSAEALERRADHARGVMSVALGRLLGDG